MELQNITLFLTTVFLGFFAILKPIGNTPVFLSLVGDADEKTIKRVAFKSTLVAFIIIAIFSLFGNLIFRMFGITLPTWLVVNGPTTGGGRQAARNSGPGVDNCVDHPKLVGGM